MSDSTPQERYLFKPFYGSSHWWALQQLETLPATSKVLDIGAGQGGIGAALGKKGWKDLSAVEIDPRAHDLLRSIYSRVENDLSKLPQQTFDVVLLLDVLEHIPNCELFFEEVKKLLSPSGVILISVPNFAHWSVRISLLAGYLPLANRGILDRTHVQYFNRARFTKLLSANGFRVENLAASIAPLEFVVPNAFYNNSLFKLFAATRFRLAQMLPGLLGYQHLGRIRKI